MPAVSVQNRVPGALHVIHISAQTHTLTRAEAAVHICEVFYVRTLYARPCVRNTYTQTASTHIIWCILLQWIKISHRFISIAFCECGYTSKQFCGLLNTKRHRTPYIIYKVHTQCIKSLIWMNYVKKNRKKLVFWYTFLTSCLTFFKPSAAFY